MLADLTRKTFGNVNMPKVCLQTLVRIVASMEPSDSLVSSCLRSEDGELIYWAIGLMHEFVVKDVARPMFRQIRGILKLVTNLLSAEEAYLTKIALRTLRFLVLHNETFQLKVVTSGSIQRIVSCLSSGDEDVQYWALALLHEVTSHRRSNTTRYYGLPRN
ncbi:hypothetical protein K493DRAFT_223270 [Basidiobolus meristosporus CBS 931.73]|uniref:Uncharacterized protein n=1 Tax=Basidiobolus meristosporus CBS 931.73 TaxID=1314790 RepID=A0A1Y1Y6D1_9FUNG|nr:hypothetical protein K493DRAFT_223270 [Basidiobolus meristosporus CBS 931.73]|eukprot:ORX93455.1 hypothetical protein K493DRAFT_223270 [Basidiobolus meristosporus CBS 931.73]